MSGSKSEVWALGLLHSSFPTFSQSLSFFIICSLFILRFHGGRRGLFSNSFVIGPWPIMVVSVVAVLSLQKNICDTLEGKHHARRAKKDSRGGVGTYAHSHALGSKNSIYYSLFI